MSTQTYEFTGAEAYERYFVPMIPAPLTTDLLQVVPLEAGQRVIDVACGTGIVARRAAEKVGPGGHVAGTDVAPEMLEEAEKVAEAAGLSIEWRQAGADALPFPDDAFDIAFCQLGLMLVPDKAAAVAEMRRVLVERGRVGILTPGRIQPLFQVFDDALARHISPDLAGFVQGVFSLHDPAEVERHLKEAGFDDVKAWEVTKTFRLPAPADLLWQYVSATPIGNFVASAPPEAQAALEQELVEAWQAHTDGDGIVYDQPVVFATGRA